MWGGVRRVKGEGYGTEVVRGLEGGGGGTRWG
jgi:hypothetical protein